VGSVTPEPIGDLILVNQVLLDELGNRRRRRREDGATGDIRREAAKGRGGAIYDYFNGEHYCPRFITRAP
jgi:hypothetical protein